MFKSIEGKSGVRTIDDDEDKNERDGEERESEDPGEEGSGKSQGESWDKDEKIIEDVVDIEDAQEIEMPHESSASVSSQEMPHERSVPVSSQEKGKKRMIEGEVFLIS